MFLTVNPINQFELLRKEFAKEMFPLINVYEEKDSIVMAAQMPGVKKDDVTIEINDNVLKITGKRAETYENEEASVVRREYVSESFERTLALPDRVNQEDVQAKLENGVLMITLPKMAEDQPRRIEISA